ncbi:MAG: serine hydrolase domain-containing protein [Balneolaceae bacterium]
MIKKIAYKDIKKFTVIGFLCLLCITGCGSPDKSEHHDTLSSRLDSLMAIHIEQGKIPGAVLQVKKGNQVLYSKAFGYAHLFDYNLDSLRNPDVMTTDHLFDLASLTKVLGTTMGMMFLSDKGLIQLDDAIYKYLPEFNKPEKSKITIRHLLTHSAGLYEWQPLYFKASIKTERYHAIAEMPLKYDVGKGRHYSDLGFMLLGDIIEIVSGLPLDDFFAQQLFEPLGLRHTAFNPPDHQFEKIAATSHGNPFEKRMVYDDSFGFKAEINPDEWNGWREYTLKGEVNDGNSWYANGGVAGHAGIFSTVSDIQKIVDLLMNDGRIDDEPFITMNTIDNFLKKDRFGNALGWAMNPDIIKIPDIKEPAFGHTGFTGTSVVFIPDERLSVILLTNRQNAGTFENGYYHDLGEIRKSIFQTVYEFLIQPGSKSNY